MRLPPLSREARRARSSDAGVTTGAEGSRPSNFVAGAAAAGCSATSPGSTSTDTPPFDRAVRIAVSSMRGIWVVLETSSQ